MTGHRFSIERLTGDYPVTAFRCGDDDLDEFLHRDAWMLQQADLAQTYLATESGVLAGYVTLLSDSIWITEDELTCLNLPAHAPRNIPALKVGRIASSKTHRGRGAGTTLMRFARSRLMAISQEAGCRLLTVDSYPVRVSFYEHLGFVHNQHPSYQGKRRTNVSMRFDAAAPTLPDWTR